MEEESYINWFGYLKKISGIDNFISKEVLDLCCGTGIMAYHFAKQKSIVTGVDISREMLEYADMRAFKNNIRFNLMCMDILNLKINKKFDFIYSICDSINYIHEKEKLLLIIDNVYNMLKDGCVFTFDYIAKENLLNIDSEEIYDIDEYKFLVSRKKNNDLLKTKIDVLNDGNIINIADHTQKCFSYNEIDEIISLSKFKNSIKYDFGSFKSENKNSDKVQYVLKK